MILKSENFCIPWNINGVSKNDPSLVVTITISIWSNREIVNDITERILTIYSRQSFLFSFSLKNPWFEYLLHAWKKSIG